MVKKKSDNAELNADQSAKSREGNAFSIKTGETLDKLAKEEANFHYGGKEPKASGPYINERGELCKGPAVRPDHKSYIVNHIKRQILIIASDSTTTQRGQRIKEKAFEGVLMGLLKQKIKNEFFVTHPQYREYNIDVAFIVLYPAELNQKLNNWAREERYVRDFCVEVNYGTSALRSGKTNDALDAACKLNELVDIVKKIDANPEKYELDRDVIADVWKSLHQDYEFMPPLAITDWNIAMQPDRLKHSLEYYRHVYFNEYFKKFTMGFMDAHNIGKTTKLTQEEMLQVVAEMIEERIRGACA